MIRNLNYTGRVELLREDIDLRRVGDGFSIALRLAEYEFPPDAAIYLEAYNKAPEFMRFPLGTVGAFSFPRDSSLSGFSGAYAINFRIKIVAVSGRPHLLLAQRDKLLATEPGEDSGAKQPLLKLRPANLDELVWRLDLDAEIPVLQINNCIGNVHVLGASPLFRGLVMPEVVRQILNRALIGDPPTDLEDQSDWRVAWLKYIATVPGIQDVAFDADVERKSQFVDDAVMAVARYKLFFENFRREYVSLRHDTEGAGS